MAALGSNRVEKSTDSVGGQIGRQQTLLEIAGDLELVLEDLLLGDGQDRLFEVGGHLVERALELAHLIPAAHRNAHGKLAPPDRVGSPTEAVDRAAEGEDHVERHGDGDPIDACQQPSDGNETGPDRGVHLGRGREQVAIDDRADCR